MSYLPLDELVPALREIGNRYLDVPIPRVALRRQRFVAPTVSDVEGAARAAAELVAANAGRSPGAIAVGVGSRGIANLDAIVRGTVSGLRNGGWQPFIVPAMGSHGAATAEGQAEVLASMGVTEESVGAPVRATMETRIVGELDGLPYHVDRYAVEAGAVLVVSRVKPHTSFRAPVESGPSKMCAVGLGKQPGAQLIHNEGSEGLARRVPLAPRLLQRAGLLVGSVAVVENQRDETASVVGLTADQVGSREEEAMLEQAWRLMPRLPFETIDVLVVDRMGKDISGTGIDSNVINRYRIVGWEESGTPFIRTIAVMDLTDASHGNAAGIGLADFVPARLMARVDLRALYTNSITAGLFGVERSKLPMVLADDRDAVRAAIAMCGVPPNAVRLAWIHDTLHTEVMALSPALIAEADQLEPAGDPIEMQFGADGRLEPLLQD
ncbi:MAG TPA: DUF2088 domain-containing protein [Candidatus Dormibacteraeota bacterium]